MDDPRARALAAFERAVWIVTARADEACAGLVATFVNSASLVPTLPRLVVGLAHHHHTSTVIARSRAFAAHLVDEGAIDLVWRFGLASGHDADKFKGLAWQSATSGSPVLAGALAWLDCRVEAAFDIGDRAILLGEVVGGGVNREGHALTANRVFALATPEQRRTMELDRQRDEAIDEAAIAAWRAAPTARR